MTQGATPYPVAARELLRATLLDAALEQMRHRPWAEVTMAHVARAAGVSRQTLYNEFGSRDEFAQALVLREGGRFLSAVEDAIAANAGDPYRALEAALDVFLSAAADDPLVRSLIMGNAELLPLVTTQGEPLVEFAAERLTAMILEHWPDVLRADAKLLAECVVRLAISYATLPAPTARSVTRLLAPFLEQALASSRVP